MPRPFCKNITELKAYLKCTSEDERMELLNDEPFMFQHINCAADLHELFFLHRAVNRVETQQFFTRFETKILSLINSIKDLREIAYYTGDEFVLKGSDKILASGTLPTFTSIVQFSDALIATKGQLHTQIFEDLKKVTPFSKFAQSSDNLRTLMTLCSKDEQQELYIKFKADIFNLISSFAELDNFRFVLTETQQLEIAEHIRKTNPQPQNALSLKEYMATFRFNRGSNSKTIKELGDEVFNLNLVKSFDDLFTLTLALGEQERCEFFHLFEQHVLDLFNTPKDLRTRYISLPATIMEKICDKLSYTYKPDPEATVSVYKDLIYNTAGELRRKVFQELKQPEFLEKKVKSTFDIWCIFIYCSQSERDDLYLDYKDKLFALTSSMTEMERIVDLLNDYQKNDLRNHVMRQQSLMVTPANQSSNVDNATIRTTVSPVVNNPQDSDKDTTGPAPVSNQENVVTTFPAPSDPSFATENSTNAERTIMAPAKDKQNEDHDTATQQKASRLAAKGTTSDYNTPSSSFQKMIYLRLLIRKINEYRTQRNSVAEQSEYHYCWLPSFFQKSKTDKLGSTDDLLKVLNALAHNEKSPAVDLLKNKEVFRNGRLGTLLRRFMKEGLVDELLGKEIRTVSAFIEELDKMIHNVPTTVPLRG